MALSSLWPIKASLQCDFVTTSILLSVDPFMAYQSQDDGQ